MIILSTTFSKFPINNEIYLPDRTSKKKERNYIPSFPLAKNRPNFPQTCHRTTAKCRSTTFSRPYIYLHASRTNSVIGYPDIRRSSVGHRNGSSVHPHLHHFSSSSSFTLPYYFIFLKTRADKTAAIAGFHAAFPPAVLARSTTVFSRLYADRRTHRYASVHVPAEVASSLRVSKVRPATPQFEHTFFRLVRAACCEHLYPEQDVWNV